MLNKLEQLRKNRDSDQSGFTIIEVMIVLAIAGLIILIVFLAIPALQRNARNTETRSEVSRILGATSEFVSNRNGTQPTPSTSTTSGSDAAAVKDLAATKNITTIVIEAENGTTAPGASQAVIRLAAKCNAANNETDPGTGRQIAIVYQAENSSGTITSCTQS